MAKNIDKTDKPDKTDPDAWRKSILPEDCAPATGTEASGTDATSTDNALLRSYAEMVQNAIHPDPDRSC
ncbi:MAG: hypothetical protein V4488_06565 [Pseudomonadota bacterium]